MSLVKDLDINFDTKLKFKEYINKIKNKATSKLGFLKRSCSDFNPQALKIIYFTLIRSQLEYATLIWSLNSLVNTHILESIQNNFLRFLSYKCRVERQPHTNYDGILEFFSMSSLKNRRNNLILNFLFKLINNQIYCNYLLRKLNFKIDSNNTRNTNLFFLQNIHSDYSIHSPANMLMSVGNSANIDTFFCNINNIKNLFK